MNEIYTSDSAKTINVSKKFKEDRMISDDNSKQSSVEAEQNQSVKSAQQHVNFKKRKPSDESHQPIHRNHGKNEENYEDAMDSARSGQSRNGEQTERQLIK